jgi:acetyltransferase-like isoleucine patch superfamily enzyme
MYMTDNKILKILGEGAWLNYAYSAAHEYGRWDQIELVALKKIDDYSYDLTELSVPEELVDYFIAIDGRMYGTVREKLLADLISRGFKIVSIIPSDMLSLVNSINCLISCNSKIHTPNFKIQFNTFIGPFVSISSGLSTGRSVTIGPYTEIDSGVKIGKNVTINGLNKISEDILIGEYSRIETLHSVIRPIEPFNSFIKLFPGRVSIKNA